MRIGIWCDYGARSLSPTEGIGVFVSNLVRGLLQQPEELEFVLLAHPGDHETLEPLRRLAPRRIRIVPTPPPVGLPRRTAKAWLATTACLRAPLGWLRARRVALRPRLAGWGEALLRRVRRREPLVLAALTVAAPPAGLAAWAGYGAWQVASALLRFASLPLRLVERLARAMAAPPPAAQPPEPYSPLKQAQAAGCDVWVLPHLGVEHPLDFPSVLFIHDLVVHHFPEGFSPQFTEIVMAVARARAAEATVCACMSEFIKQTDLLGVLGLPEERVRMVRPAPPVDLPDVGHRRAGELLPVPLPRPYLFYPAAFRSYKNHALLIRALAVLRDEHGDDSLDLVFTGPNADFPDDLRALAGKLGVADRVHAVGKVNRQVLAALYRSALATVVPSLYEQGSFPIYEALGQGCPVACSDIPSLREQCAAMGEAMLYFDPRDARSLASAVLRLRDAREAVRAAQEAARPALYARTWNQVAADWLAVFRQAARLGPRAKAAPARLAA